MNRPTAIVAILIPLLLFDQHADSQESESRDARDSSAPRLLDLYEARKFQDMPYRLMRPIDLADNPDVKCPFNSQSPRRSRQGNRQPQNLFRHWNQVMAEGELRRKHPAFVVAPQSTLPWIAPGSVPEITEDVIQNAAPLFRERLKEFAPHQKMLGAGLVAEGVRFAGCIGRRIQHRYRPGVCTRACHGRRGTWNAIVERPERFAAAIPSSGSPMPWTDFQRIVDVPIWTFHGDADPIVTVEYTRWAFAKLKALKANTKYTELKKMHHGSAPVAFNYTGDDPQKGYVTHFASDRCDRTANVWDWLFALKRDR